MKYLSEHIRAIMAISTLVFGFAYIFTMLITGKEVQAEILITLVAILKEPYSYYYGSTNSSSKKDETINDLAKNK